MDKLAPPMIGLLLLMAMKTEKQAQPNALIQVDAAKFMHSVSRYLTGACIEDVNHEIYGGIYSQMVFGESFQEPASSAPMGFKAFGGNWRAQSGDLQFVGSPGDRLVSELVPFKDGKVGVQVFVPDRSATNVGLIVRVSEAGRGIDNFKGYEIALNPAEQSVRLGRHRHNWEPISDTPCEIPIRRWVKLEVTLSGATIQISVNGKKVVSYTDTEHRLLEGTVGLRQFQSTARYGKLWYQTDGEPMNLPFADSSGDRHEVSGMWRSVVAGDSEGSFNLVSEKPFVGKQAQRITFLSGHGEVGVENKGLNRWGMHFETGKPYEGVIWARAASDQDIYVSAGKAAETSVKLKSGDWQKLTYSLTPNQTVDDGHLAITLRKPGTVDLGYVSLQPGPWGRYKGLPIRRDVTEALIKQGISVLRYGGSMINHPEYRWKKMVGPRDRRQPNPGTWYPYSTNGWGIPDFLNLCEAAGFLGVPDFNMDETPQDMADFIEYANGPAASSWGEKRVAYGHPSPYNLKYIQLGNEERVDEGYFAKLKPLAEAIWKADPNITIVVGDFLYHERIVDPFKFGNSASGITTLAVQQKILKLAKEHGREVWFDLHVDTEGPIPGPSLDGAFSFIDALENLADGAKFKVVIFEFNAGNHSQRRALANAIGLNAVERDGRIPIVTSANCLQPDGQNDNDWDQGLLFLNPSQVWLQPPGYVTQMYSLAYQPSVVQSSASGGLDVVAKKSADGKTLVLRVVNASDSPVTASLEISGFVPASPEASVTCLVGDLGAANTASSPKTIVPKRSKLALSSRKCTFAARSVTVVVIK